MISAQSIPNGQLWRYRELVREHGDVEARRLLRVEASEAKRNRTFEEKLADLANGKGRVVAAFKPHRQAHDFTLGGVTAEAI